MNKACQIVATLLREDDQGDSFDKKYPDTLAGAISFLGDASDLPMDGAAGRPDPQVDGVWEVTIPDGRRTIVYLKGYPEPAGGTRKYNDFEVDDRGFREDVAQTDKPPVEVDGPVEGEEEEPDDEDLDDAQEYEAEGLWAQSWVARNLHPLYERLDKEDRAEIDKRVAAALKSKEVKETVREIVKKVLKDFYQTMYTRRTFWLNEL